MSGQKKYQTFLPSDPSDTSEDEADQVLRALFKSQTSKGYSVVTAAVFITSLMAGMGVLALPHALAETGWYGLVLVGVACVNSWYSASILGRSWILLEERWEEYRGKFRYPYPAMGLRALGSWMRYTVSITLDVTLMGVAVVYILLSAEIAQSMMQRFLAIDYSYWIIILAAVLCPLTWFGSLEDFWLAAVGALVTAALVCYSLLASALLQWTEAKGRARYDAPTFSSFSLAFGTILFSFGGVFFFPTIQNDMAKRKQFGKASLLGFAGLLLLYMPITVVGYAVYGSGVPPNILLTVKGQYLRIFVEASLAAHVLLAFLLVLNPVAQELEEFFNIKPSFNYKRCLVRSLLVLVVTMVAYTIPHFDKIMNLIGGSTMTLLTFIFPPLFYICLSYNDDTKLQPYKRIATCEMLFLFQIMLIGIAGGVACTYFAIKDIVSIFF